MICPQCRSADCHRSHRDGVFDFFGGVAGFKPWRCHTCEHRFHARQVAVSLAAYAHCPKCGNFNLDHLSRDRVEHGTLIFLKRWLGCPAYRCEPCRERFFSLRPFRRILPSTAPAAGQRRA